MGAWGATNDNDFSLDAEVQCSTTPSLTTVPSLTWLFSLLAFADTLENLFINYISGLDYNRMV